MPAVCGYFDNHDVVAVLRDGRLIAMGEFEQRVFEVSANTPVIVQLPDLKYIEYIISVQFYSDPDSHFTGFAYMDKKITGNCVGMTLNQLDVNDPKETYAAINVRVIAVGPP